jgi:hypothetical protein
VERQILATLAGPYSQRHVAPRSHWRARNHVGVASDLDLTLSRPSFSSGTARVRSQIDTGPTWRRSPRPWSMPIGGRSKV